jgi:hypothetical protein
MKYTAPVLAVLALLPAGLARAAPPQGPKLHRAGKQKQKLPAARKGKHLVLHGHHLMAPARMKALKSGTHHLHTCQHGVRAAAVLRNGKLAGMKVVDRRGKPVRVERFKQRGTRLPGARPGAAGPAASPRAVPAAHLDAFIIFRYCHPCTGNYVYFFWPACLCVTPP